MITQKNIKKQPSFILYLIFGLTTLGASALVFFILFFSAFFKVSITNHYALLVIGFTYGMSLFSIFALVYNWRVAPERARALQSHQTLTIASETLKYLRQGFNLETAEKVAEIIYKYSDADAVAVTNNEVIMAYSGAGAYCHKPGDIPLKNSKMEDEIVGNHLQIYNIKDAACCPDKGDFCCTVVSAPLTIEKRPIGALELLFRLPQKVTESHIIVTRGLGKLLSTQLALSELEKQRNLAFQAEFKALRAQINPHFLFNTLNTIAVLCRTEPQKARKLLLRFSEFFRDSLERQSQTSTFEEELNYVNSYLVLEKARFGSKLKIHREIEPAALEVVIPSLIVQPLVENAVKHGMAGGSILNLNLSAKLIGDNLIISVKDDGIGMDLSNISLDAPDYEGLGIGLRNVCDRLSALYDSMKLISIDSEIGKGAEVILRIPDKVGMKCRLKY